MIEIYLDDYRNYDWNNSKDYLKVMNAAIKRKYKYYRDVNLTVDGDLNPLQKLSLNRFISCKNLYDSRVQSNKKGFNKVALRSYRHKLCDYDDMNELERYGTGEYARDYIILISFEDALDFIYSDLLKTKSNSLIEFCEKKDLNYNIYSRSILGGGKYGKLLMNDLLGFSESYDVLLKIIGNDMSLEKRLFFTKFSKFCVDFRNSLVLNCGINFIEDSIIASVGVSSIVYYCNIDIDEEIVVYSKSSKITLKVLCYERNDYINVIENNLSY